MKNVVIFKILNNNSIKISFNYNEALVEMVRAIPGRKYIKERRVWIIPKSPNEKTNIHKYFDNSVILNFEEEKQERSIPEGYLNELNLRRYSRNTKRAYLGSFRRFIDYYGKKEISTLTDEDVNSYITYLVENRKVSTAIQKQAVNAIKFYFEKVLRRSVKVLEGM